MGEEAYHKRHISQINSKQETTTMKDTEGHRDRDEEAQGPW